MKKIIIFILLLFSNYLYSQDTIKKSLIIKTALLSWMDPFYPVIQVGCEYKINNKIGLQIDFGSNFYIQDFGMKGRNLNNRQTVKIKSEFRYYPHGKQFYIGVEYFYLYSIFNEFNNKYKSLDGTWFNYNSARISKSIHIPDFRIGIERGEKIYWDFYCGIGWRFGNVKYSNIENKTIIPENPFIESFIPINLNEGSFTTLHLNMGVKIGYKIF